MIAFLSKSDASAGFDQIMDFLNVQVIHYALMVNLTIYVSCIKQFWATALIMKVNDVVKLQALIDRKKVVIAEDIIRQVLRLNDDDGVVCLPTEENFAELARMGYEKPPPKLTFYKNTSPALTQMVLANIKRIGKGFSGVETPLFATMLVQSQATTKEEDEVPAAP
nr:hypothetical protein [Tanacetum cinerariifolium]